MLPSGMSVWWICALEPASPRLPGKDWENRTVFASASWYQEEDVNLDMSQLLLIQRERNRDTGNGGPWGLGSQMPWDQAEQRWHWEGAKWALTSPVQPLGSEGRCYRLLAGLQLPDPGQWGGPCSWEGHRWPQYLHAWAFRCPHPLTTPPHNPADRTSTPHVARGAVVEGGASGLNWILECPCGAETTPQPSTGLLFTWSSLWLSQVTKLTDSNINSAHRFVQDLFNNTEFFKQIF